MPHLGDLAHEGPDEGQEGREVRPAPEAPHVALGAVPLDAQDVGEGVVGAARQLPGQRVRARPQVRLRLGVGRLERRPVVGDERVADVLDDHAGAQAKSRA